MIFTTPGEVVVVVPAGKTHMLAECWGAGGGGKKGGGGGGAFSQVNAQAVTAGTKLTVSVGPGGQGSSTGTPANGGYSGVLLPGNVFAVKAAGGKAGTDTDDILGGSASDCIGDTTYAGSKGALSSGDLGGGGGGGASALQSGGDASGPVGGSFGGGHGCDNGASPVVLGNPGANPAGGGSGDPTGSAGLAGGNGQVIIYFS